MLDKARYLLQNNMAASAEAIQLLDDFLFQLAVQLLDGNLFSISNLLIAIFLQNSVTVDLMPGAQDPTNNVLPQQALHNCMLPQSSMLSTFFTVNNPYCCRIGGRVFLGNSGQPIHDIWKNSKLASALHAMEKTLEWRHMCPTAPDTLGCYPYVDDDPFILDTCPDLYFAGNQDTFEDRLWKGKSHLYGKDLQHSFICSTGPEGQTFRLISVPRFSETGTVVLIDVNTLECHTLTFGTGD